MTDDFKIGQTAPREKLQQLAIIGATGRMGNMLAEKAENAGFMVSRLDIPFEKAKLQAGLKNAQMVLFCVPAKHLKETLKIVTPWMPPEAILADITSVKEMPMRLMQEIWPGPVVGTHPLFGPRQYPGDNPHVVIVPGTKAGREDTELVSGFFHALGFKTFEETAAKHDQAMAKIQNMNFITTLAYFAVLAGQKDLLPFLTPSFERRKNAAKKMLTEDADMFGGLFEANGHSNEAVRQYRKMLNIAASGDIDLLCKKARWWWKDEQ